MCNLNMLNSNLTRTSISQNAAGMTKWVVRLIWFAVSTTAVDFTSKLYLRASQSRRAVARSQVHAYEATAWDSQLILLFRAIFPGNEACLVIKCNSNPEHTNRNATSKFVPFPFSFHLKTFRSTVCVGRRLCVG